MCNAICCILDWIERNLWGSTVEEHIDFLTFISVAIGGMFALYQWKKSTALKRADYIKELTEKIRTDESIFETIYLFDYSQEWYNSDFHQSGDLERKVDRTLAHFSYILYLKKEKIISEKEFIFFKYDIERILFSDQTQDYFYNLFHFSQTQGIPFSFNILLDYAKENNLVDADFNDSKAFQRNAKYHQYLNF